MRVVVVIFISALFLYAGDQVYECNKIFEQRKAELVQKIEKIDEAREAYEALRAATNALLDKKREMLLQKEKDINATMQKIKLKEKDIKDLISKNQQLLKAIKEAKDDKISLTYSKMKDSSAAQILSNMKTFEACKILFNLKPKKISKIMAKMSPQKASKITQMLLVGPPFKEKK